ncbi:MAG: M48 family metallopeptidase [Candidatus Gastranaerophilales bacterium]|nr:M48 family metallopeptidase [Candidatus Gastranaerophilales bacterium]
MQNDDFERQRILIEGENVNISETNVLRELLQIVINIALWGFIIYFSIFIISGIAIKTLPIEKQIMLENLLSKIVDIDETVDIDKKSNEKLNTIKNKILKYDKNFPKTSKLNIEIIKDEEPNALCLPNGNIYITSALYDKIKTDDGMLLFVLAHEMAHYKNKDHIMGLRKGIASGAVLLIVSLSGKDNSDLYKIIENTVDLSDLNYSRGVEARADVYAGKMLLSEYNNVYGGIKALELLKDKKYPEIFSIFSTHPSIEKRIENLKKIEEKRN